MTVDVVVDEGLGNVAYLVDLGDGRGLAVDPPRDLRALRAAAGRRGLRIAFAADTHLHADFLSGARQLAAVDGARILASAAGGRVFEHTGLEDGDEADLGGLRLRAWSTPGHTTEHVAFLLLDDGRPLGVFTGGSLLVGSAARTDLVAPGDPERAVELARAQYASVRRLLTLPDPTPVWPTHGAGSFCSAPSSAERTSTIGDERAGNPLLRDGTPDGFVSRLLAGLGSYPPYFRRLAEANRLGPAVLAEPVTLPALDAARVRALLADGAQLVDVRLVARYAAAHVPGSVSIPLRPVFATWLGWLADPDRPLVVLRDADQDPAEIVGQALKIGHENLAGEFAGGIAAWTAHGGATASTRLVRPGEIGGRPLVDVRQRSEYALGHVPGAVHVELGDVARRAGDLRDAVPDGAVVMCGHGERAAGAAGLLEAAGYTGLGILVGGPRDCAAETGTGLAVGTGPTGAG